MKRPGGPEPVDDALTRAFQLAYFIHPDRFLALQIALGALAKLNVASDAQDKRLYYRSELKAKAAKHDIFRTKVSLSELHLLQRLIYLESDPHERQAEQADATPGVSHDDLIVHFAKHLVQITMRRNSFYVTLGLSRLLYGYSTAEAMQLYDVLVQDAGWAKDDSYYRSRKGVLMQELKDRFGSLINIRHAQRGEERFEAQENSARDAGLVRECLDRFTPWNTSCLIPVGFGAGSAEISRLSFGGDHPNDTNATEVNRMHALLHPHCFRRLTELLRFAAPDRRLEIPRFFLATGRDDSKGPPADRRRPPDLTTEELLVIRAELAERAARRRRVTAGLLRILVDGTEVVCLEPRRSGRARFEVAKRAELVEVRADDDGREVLLATHLLTHDETGDRFQNAESSIVLEGGQKLSFAVSCPANADREAATAFVDVGYEETAPFKAAGLAFRQIGFRFSELLQGAKGRPAAVFKPALTLALLAVFAAGVTLYLKSKRPPEPPSAVLKRPEQGKEAAKRVPKPSAPAQNVAPLPLAEQTVTRPATPRPAVSPRAGQETDLPPADERIALKPRSGERLATERPAASETEETRALRPGTRAARLHDVRRIYVEAVGEEPSRHRLSKALGNGLQASNVVSIVQNREDADAVLKIKVERDKGTPAGAAVFRGQLINANGDIIWPTARTDSGGQYRGSPEEASRKAVADLLREIRDPEQEP